MAWVEVFGGQRSLAFELTTARRGPTLGLRFTSTRHPSSRRVSVERVDCILIIIEMCNMSCLVNHTSGILIFFPVILYRYRHH